MDALQEQHQQQTGKSTPTTAPQQPAPLAPVAVGARSSRNTIALHEKYQALGIQPPMLAFSGSSHEGWNVQTDFLGVKLEARGPFSNKQEAKEVLSGQALAVIKSQENDGTLRAVVRCKKSAGGGGVDSKGEPVVNYIGQLLEFQRARNADQPTYTDYQLGRYYSCTLTLESHPTPFGSTTTSFPSKKAARQDAARCAVEHFQAAGVWPKNIANVGGIKKKAKGPTAATTNNNNNNIKTESSQPQPQPLTNGAIGTESYASRVATLACTLSLTTPEWRYHPEQPGDNGGSGFHTVTCHFKNGGVNAGPIGEVRHQYGKKKAKEECAKRTLEYLEGVRERRVALGRRMMERVAEDDGGTGVVDGAAPRLREEREEGGVVVKMEEGEEQGVAVKMEEGEEQGVAVKMESSDGEDGFEDALEELDEAVIKGDV
ncbi:hypothetical protein BDV95DRAFT_499939 [Massariosphaeria phaeospora]|uniref:DRBM domain-containing protein n=1 Tax=Massariosphaeria phaeospora TaxID=100035 RepID=A0A7C8I9P4_9PLEO|nr:hypothetical protein BDV95DRAFT_499939 [Massariosphaeria phaeospora]